MVKSGITQDEVISWGGAEVFNQALALCNSGKVHAVRYDDSALTVSGTIELADGHEMSTAFRLEAKGRIRSMCPCATNQRYGMVCAHVVALGLALAIMEMDDAPEPKDEPPCNETPPGNETEAARYIEVPMTPRFYALVCGSRASLSIELDAYYGEINFPACSIQAEKTVYLRDPDDDLVRRTRSLKAEKDAIDELKRWGFEPGYREHDLRLYLTDPQKVLNFLGAGYPAFRRRANWRIDLAESLSKLYDTFHNIIPVVKVKDVDDGHFDVRYSFEADGRRIPPVEIQAALNRHDGCLIRDGQVYLLDNNAIARMHDVFRDCATTQGDAPAGWFRVRNIHAPYVKASLDELLDAIDLDDDEATNWRERADRQNNRDARYEPIVLGKLETVLRPYQKQGVYWLRFLEEAGFAGLLADEMGLGKTLQTLTWISLIRNRQGPALIVCPTSLVRNWEQEARKFTPELRPLVLSGPERERAFRRMDDADLVITSYALLQRDFEAAYLGRRFSAVVIDEAQHIKNRETKNAKAVKFLNAKRRLALTGTPVENSVSDVWSIFEFLMPDYLGDYESFKLNFENPIRSGEASEALERLKRKLNPFILRRVKKMVAKDLPDKITKISYCPMSDDAQREYIEALAMTRAKTGSMVQAKGFAKSKFEILAMLMKLRQISSRAKKDAFMEQLVSAVEEGHKILVFSQFVSMLKILQDELRKQDIPFCYLDGSTKDRLGECERFNRSPTIPVFLISLMAGGTGLNLTGADMVMHYDPWWNPAVEDQATDRAHRIGQHKTVYVIKMIASGSIEEKVLALQRRKQAIIAATVSTTDQAVMDTLTAADIDELLA